MSKTKDYAFFADCHGLCGIEEIRTLKIFRSMSVRAWANPQRFCVWGTISLTKEVYELLQSMCCRDDDRKIALNAIKESQFCFSKEEANRFKRILKRIPNDSLDPM